MSQLFDRPTLFSESCASAWITWVWLAAMVLCLSSPVAVALTVSAPDATIRIRGENMDGAVLFVSQGEVGEYIAVAQGGSYEIAVRCTGRSGNARPGKMAIVVDGMADRSHPITWEEPRDVAVVAQLAPGVHTVRVAFLNEGKRERVERWIRISQIVVRPASDGADEPVVVSAQQWQQENDRREAALLQRSGAEIQQHRTGEATLQLLDPERRPLANVPVVIELKNHEFLFGCNIFTLNQFRDDVQANERYKQRFKDLFNYATTNFYWRDYEPEDGKPRYDYTDGVVKWCQSNGIRLKGHPLLWAQESGTTTWANDQQPPAARQERRVREIVSRFAGQIDFWEVVNEPSHLVSLEIDAPHRWAREANPSAKLIINDYMALGNSCPTFYEFLEQAIARGVPFDGIGIQAHEPLGARFPLAEAYDILTHYAALGKPLHITELTPPSVGPVTLGAIPDSQWSEAEQADYADKFYRVCFAHPAIASITWWDLADGHSWQPGGGLVRPDMSPKPVYEALRKLIRQTWHTRIEGKTDAAGHITFRGFYGNYDVRIDAPQGALGAGFNLSKGEKNDLTLTTARHE